MKLLHSNTISEWCQRIPELKQLIDYQPTLWCNPRVEQPTALSLEKIHLSYHQLKDASSRLRRFQPYLAAAFPETTANNGQLESPLVDTPQMFRALESHYTITLPGRLLLKCDNLLPISGSIKARGGIYEVLVHAERLALKHGLLRKEDDYTRLASTECKEFFKDFSIAVGSTGNLGLSIGIMGACLGFKVTVHMSADGREWKKERLRSHGVEVVEYRSDYSIAVAAGRRQAKDDPRCHFIDDENSTDLFFGYGVAAERLAQQLKNLEIEVNSHHPLFVYLPCGVGGGPGGITFGLKQLYGDNVHCFFAEPTHSPCMLLGLATELHDTICVEDFGLDNKTAADGLAVGRPSGFIGRTLAALINGVYTLTDQEMYRLLAMMIDSENIALEPSAAAGLAGIVRIMSSNYLTRLNLGHLADNCTHIAWGTGGSMVPAEEMASYYRQGKL